MPKPTRADKDVAAMERREDRIAKANAFREMIDAASLPEPFAGAIVEATRNWHATIDAAFWSELRAAMAEGQAVAADRELRQLRDADTANPDVAALVERVAQRAFSQMITQLAAKADVNVTVMAATVGALSGEPVPPALADEVFSLLINTAEPLTNDHEQAS